jgi:ribosomal protein S18 acetylase RimI-like enzyme
MMTVKDVPETYIDELVTVHIDAFPNFFLTDLGRDFLKLYYDSVRRSSHGILLGVFYDDKLLGFCAACTESNGFNKSLIKQDWLKYAYMSVKILLTSPMALIRLGKNLTKHADASDDGQYAELLSIGVAQSAQGKGVGKLLLNQLENHLREQNVELLSLTTDYYDNDKTLQFYKARQFNIMNEFITYPNRKMYRLDKMLKTEK